jgi:hypothetical protein
LDELAPFQESEVALDEDRLVKPVEQYIDDFLDEATDTVRLICPEHRMKAVGFEDYWDGSDGSDDWDDVFEEKTLDDGIVYYQFKVPDDFLKIAEVRMENWGRSCFSATPEGGEAYRLLRNPYTTAGPAKPAVVVTGEKIALYGSRVSGFGLSVGTYINSQYYDEDGGPVQDGLVDNAIVWRCAALVLGVMGRADVLKQAEAFYVEAVRQLQ